MNAKLAITLLATLALAILLPATGHAQQPALHPRYLHALGDLRAARAHLERRGGDHAMKWDERVAISEIDAAIGEIKKAAIDDGKNLNDHPPIDPKFEYGGRLHRALDLLNKAHVDVKEGEDDNFAHGLRHRALEHIDNAINLTSQGIANAERR